jgi:biotin carboxyl carrier protein
MFKVTVNNRFAYDIESKVNDVTVNGAGFVADMVKLSTNNYHFIYQDKSHLAEVVNLNSADKTAVIKINDNIYNLTAKDQFDTLLEQLGMSNLNAAKIMDVKAPMPGLVLKVLVKEGDEVKKGDNLFILEAMKMENIIKAPADAIVKNVKVQPADKVEKGQLLLVFK